MFGIPATKTTNRAATVFGLPVVVLVGLVVAGCGSQVSGGTSPGSAPLSTPSPRSLATPVPPVKDSSPLGLQAGLLGCSGNEWLRLDPSTGNVTAKMTFSLQGQAGPRTLELAGGLGCPTPNQFQVPSPNEVLDFRERFDHSLQRVVATTDTFPDGSQHVGFVDIASGQFTDVTAKTTSSGFSSEVVTDADPHFNLKGDHLWFTRSTASTKSDLYDVELSSFHARKVTSLSMTSCTMGGTCSSDYVITASDTPLPTFRTETLLPNTSGTRAAERLLSGTYGAGVHVFTDLSTIVKAGGLEGFSLQPAGPEEIVVYRERVASPGAAAETINSITCNPLAWIDDTRLMCQLTKVGATSSINIVDLSQAVESQCTRWVMGNSYAAATCTTVTSAPLLPANDRTNFAFVVSPDHRAAEFLSQQPGSATTTLYREDLSSAGASPTMIADTSVFLVEWD